MGISAGMGSLGKMGRVLYSIMVYPLILIPIFRWRFRLKRPFWWQRRGDAHTHTNKHFIWCLGLVHWNCIESWGWFVDTWRLGSVHLRLGFLCGGVQNEKVGKHQNWVADERRTGER